MQESALAPGFANPVDDAQATFRTVLHAMSHPGIVCDVPACPTPPEPMLPAMAAVALMLIDHETSVWLAPSLSIPVVSDFLRFHTGASVIPDSERAVFVLAGSSQELPHASALNIGSPDFPDRSATVVLGVIGFDASSPVSLQGPGINGQCSFGASGLDIAFWQRAQANHALYPLGVDTVFCAGTQIAALPRSSKIVMNKECTGT